jgi:uncharacterized membrane protein
MIVLACLVAGALLGFLLGRNFDGVLAGVFIGGVLGLVVRTMRRPRAADPVPGAGPADLAARMVALEQRMDRLESMLTARAGAIASAPAVVTVTMLPPATAPGAGPAAASVATPVATPVAPPAATPAAPVAQARASDLASATPPPPMPAYGTHATPAASSRGDAREPGAAIASHGDAATPAAAVAPAAGWPSALWSWIVGGNTLARIGVLVLFVGVAFLVKYAAEHVSVPVQLRLLGAALLGLALLAIGWRLRESRRAYAMTLQGAGLGVLYLTAFAAFMLYQLVTAGVAFAALVALVAATGVLAVRQDAVALAVLATLGGFAAPVLVSRGGGSHVVLFAYYALLDAGVFAIAWRKPWRALNLLGFACTFVVGSAWGVTVYTPARFASTEPFLVLFFLLYVGIAVMYARHRTLELRQPVDGTLVFGTPLVVAALQAALVREHEYGMAISAAALALFYATLAAWLHRARRGASPLLVDCFVALAVTFATLAIPLAFDARWSSATWALEGAAMVWLGLRQRRTGVRAFGGFLQLAAAMMLLFEGAHAARTLATVVPFANGGFLGAALIAIAGWLSAWRYARDGAMARPGESVVAPLALAWALLWWVAAGVHEIHRFVSLERAVASLVAWLALTVALSGILSRAVRWPMALTPAIVYVPALLAIALWHGVPVAADDGHLLAGPGALAWIAALAVAIGALHALERSPAAPSLPLAGAHAVLTWLVAFVLAQEAGWATVQWVGGYAWQIAAWGLVPALLAIALLRVRTTRIWPLVRWQAAYQGAGAAGLLVVLYAGGMVANLASDGDPAPLPYVPLLNPLELTFAAIAFALGLWWRRAAEQGRVREEMRAAAVTLASLGAWLWLTMATVRTIHHWTGLPFEANAAWQSPLVQSALALVWSTAALAVMVLANRRGLRGAWMGGAVLLAAVVVKLFAVDLAQAGTVARIVSFIGVGLLMLLIGYLAPVPARRPDPVA